MSNGLALRVVLRVGRRRIEDGPSALFGHIDRVRHVRAKCPVDFGSPLDDDRFPKDHGDPRPGQRNQLAIPTGSTECGPGGVAHHYERPAGEAGHPSRTRAQRPWGAVRAIKCNRNVPVCRERPPHLPKSRDGVACAVRGKRHGRHAARDEPAPHGRTRKARRYKGAVRMGSPFGNNSQGKQVHTVPRHSDEWSRWNLSLKGDLPRAHCPTPVAGDLAAPGLGELGKWKHLSLSIPIAAVLSRSTADPNPIGRVVLHVYPTTAQHVYPTTLESAEPP